MHKIFKVNIIIIIEWAFLMLEKVAVGRRLEILDSLLRGTEKFNGCEEKPPKWTLESLSHWR